MNPRNNLLRECRLAAGLTQLRLATVAGCTEQMIYLIEHKQRLPRVDLGVRIASAMGLSVETVFPSVEQEVRINAQG